MQALRVSATRHHAAREFVDDDDFAVAHDVILVALEKLVCAERLIDVVDDGNVLHVVEGISFELAGVAQPLLKSLHAGFSQRNGSLLFIDLIVALIELWNITVDGVVEFGPVVEWTGYDQRRARLIDQNRVD